MRLSKRETILLIVLGIVVILVVGINFLILPMIKDVQAAQAELQQKSDEEMTAQADTALASEISKAIEDAYAQTEELKKPYDNSMNQEEIDLWLNNLLAKNSLEVQNMDISDMSAAATDISVATADQENTLPIQNAADIVNGKAQPSAEPSAQPSVEASAQPSAQATVSAEPTQAVQGADSLYQIDAIINCSGSFDNIIAFANDLYASGRALRITNLQTQEAGETGQTPAVFTIEFYGIPAVGDAAQQKTGDAK